jgi:hypothetical protein
MNLKITTLAGLAALVLGCAPPCERPRIPCETRHVPHERIYDRSIYCEPIDAGNEAKLLIYEQGMCDNITDSMYPYVLGELIKRYGSLEFTHVQPEEQEQASIISQNHRLTAYDLRRILGEDTDIAFVVEVSCAFRDRQYATIDFNTCIIDLDTETLLKAGTGRYDYPVGRPEYHSPIVGSLFDRDLFN